MKSQLYEMNEYAKLADLPLWYALPHPVRRGFEACFQIFMVAVTAWALDLSPGFLHASWLMATLPYGDNGTVGPFVHGVAWLLLRAFGCALLCLALATSNVIAVVVECVFTGKKLLGNERLSKAFRSFERQQLLSYAFLAVMAFFVFLVRWH